MKKVKVAVAAAGLIAAMSFMFFMAQSADWAISGVNKHPTKKTFTVEKNGVTKTIEGRKELPPISSEQPPPYDPNDREWVGDPQTWAQLQQFIRDAFQAGRDAVLYVNRGRSEELKSRLDNYFSASTGELSRRRSVIDMEIQQTPAGYGRSENIITKMDFKGISVQDNQATAVVDIYSHICYKDFNKNRDDGCGDNAEQHTVTLELENNKWLITRDLWVFMPGYGPRRKNIKPESARTLTRAG